MKSLKLNFATSGADLIPTQAVEDHYATIQACLVNLATELGSDKVHAQRGTNLLRQAVSGLLVSSQDAMHACNFAAVDTVFFVRANEPRAAAHDRVAAIRTNPMLLDKTSLRVDLQFVFVSGTEIGVIQSL